MNRRAGLTRLSILAIPYFGWWGYQAWVAREDGVVANRLREQALSAGDYDLESRWFYAGMAAKRAVEQSIFWGIYTPIALLICGAIGFWIYRGFKPKA